MGNDKSLDQINIKPPDQIKSMLIEIMNETGMGVSKLFYQWVINEYNRYYKKKTPTIMDRINKWE